MPTSESEDGKTAALCGLKSGIPVECRTSFGRSRNAHAAAQGITPEAVLRLAEHDRGGRAVPDAAIRNGAVHPTHAVLVVPHSRRIQAGPHANLVGGIPPIAGSVGGQTCGGTAIRPDRVLNGGPVGIPGCLRQAKIDGQDRRIHLRQHHRMPAPHVRDVPRGDRGILNPQGEGPIANELRLDDRLRVRAGGGALRNAARTALQADPTRRKRAMGCQVVLCGQPNLLHVVEAFRAAGSLARLLHGRHQQGDQQRNNGDDHQQLNQRESTPHTHRQGSRGWQDDRLRSHVSGLQLEISDWRSFVTRGRLKRRQLTVIASHWNCNANSTDPPASVGSFQRG